MNALVDIGINLIAALVGFWIGWVWQRLRKAVQTRRARRFWRPFVAGRLQIVVGRFLEFSSFEQSGFLGVGDAIGLSELSARLKELGLHDLVVSYADRLDGDSLKTNLILIGGPDANAVTREAVTRIGSTLQFGNPASYELVIYDSQTKRGFAPLRRMDSEKITTDYGIILKTTNPFAPTKQILIIAGSFGYGTWAGIRFVNSKQFIDCPLVQAGRPVECLVEVDIAFDTPQDIRLVTLRELGGAEQVPKTESDVHR